MHEPAPHAPRPEGTFAACGKTILLPVGDARVPPAPASSIMSVASAQSVARTRHADMPAGARSMQDLARIAAQTQSTSPVPAGEALARPRDSSRIADDVATIREAFHDPRMPPWLLAPSFEAEHTPDIAGTPWPPRRKSRLNTILRCAGLAAIGAAIVAVIALT